MRKGQRFTKRDLERLGITLDPLPRSSSPKTVRFNGEELLLQQMKEFGLPEPLREFRFDETRKWRSDFAFIRFRLLIEIEGGTWSGGRHTRGRGFERDCEKYNKASHLGYTVLRFTSEQVKDQRAIKTIISFILSKML